MYITCKKYQKIKKIVTCCLWEVDFLGLNSTLSSCSQSRSEKKGMGATLVDSWASG